ncbi:hypothetical protein L0152_09490 [bacterium]|nr:hypothetical protein [bacterium]
MKMFPGESSGELILEFETPEEFETFFDEADRNGYFELPPYGVPNNVVFRARAVGSPRSRKIKPIKILHSGEATIVHLVDPHATQSKNTKAVELPSEIPTSEGPDEGDAVASATAEVGRSLFDQIRALTVTERVTLALKADLMERRILMQENNFKINEFLLRNVRITEQEVAFMARNAGIPMQNLLAIAGNRPWMNHESIRSAILTNPRTPAAMVMDMIPTLGPQDLLKMHHAPHLREDIKTNVRRELKKRGIKIRENL